MLLDNGRTDVARRRGRPAGAALHPLLGLPERLPGLRADRRPRLRLGLPGPDRRDPHPAAARHREAPGRRADRLAALRLDAVRRLLRRLPGRASTSPRSSSTCAPRWSDSPTATHRCPTPEAVGHRRGCAWALAEPAAARPGRARGRARRSARRAARPDAATAAAGLGRSAPGPAAATCGCRRASRSGPGGGGPTAAGGGDAMSPTATEARDGDPRAASRDALADAPVARVSIPRGYERAAARRAPTSSSCSPSASATTARR